MLQQLAKLVIFFEICKIYRQIPSKKCCKTCVFLEVVSVLKVLEVLNVQGPLKLPKAIKQQSD